MLDALENGAEIWRNLLTAFVPSSSLDVTACLNTSKVSDISKASNSSSKHDCLTHLGKVYSLLLNSGDKTVEHEREANFEESEETNDEDVKGRKCRGFAFNGSRTRLNNSSASDVRENNNEYFDDFLNLFQLLNLGLLQSDQEIRCGTVVILRLLFQNIPTIFAESATRSKSGNAIVTDFADAFALSNCDSLLSRCLDLCCDANVNKGECIEVIKLYKCLLNFSKTHKLQTSGIVSTAVASGLASIVRDSLLLVSGDKDDQHKRKDIVDMALALSPMNKNALAGGGKSFSRQNTSTTRHTALSMQEEDLYPAGALVKSSVVLLSELMLVDEGAVLKSGAIAVLISFILHCPTHRLSESLLSSVLYIINFPHSRSSLSPILLHSFMAPLTSQPPPGAQVNLFTDICQEAFASNFEVKLNACMLSVITILSSWPGIFAMGAHVSKPNLTFKSGIQVLVNVLSVGDYTCKTVAMETVYHLLGVQYPVGCAFSSQSVGRNGEIIPRSSRLNKYRLDEGFVLAEFNDLHDCFSAVELNSLPTCAKTLDLVLHQRVFLFAALVQAGIIKVLKQAQEISHYVPMKPVDKLTSPEPESRESQLKSNYIYSATYLLAEVCQTYMPLLPQYYTSFFSNVCSKTNGAFRDVEIADLDAFEDLSSEASKNSAMMSLIDSGVSVNEESENSVKVLDSIVKWKRQKASGGFTFMSRRQGSQPSIFMEYLSKVYDLSSSLMPNDMDKMPKKHSLKLESHIAQLLSESNVIEQLRRNYSVESSDDSFELPDNDYSKLVPNDNSNSLGTMFTLPSYFDKSSDGNDSKPATVFTLPKFITSSFSGGGNKPNKIWAPENFARSDVGFHCRLWSWPIICSCLRYFNYNFETGLSAFACKAVQFVDYLTLYFMPSSYLFSAESYQFSQTSASDSSSSSSGFLFSKIEAGSLLFKLLADALCSSNLVTRQSPSSANATLITQFAEKARALFDDLASCLEMETRGKTDSNLGVNSVFSQTSLPDSVAQMYFMFLGGLPSHSRRTVMIEFKFIELFVSILLVGSNLPLCKLILVCMPYADYAETCQLMEVAVRTCAAKQIQHFAIQFLSILVGFWREGSRVLPWKDYGATKLSWLVDMLYECVFNQDYVIRDMGLSELLEISTDNRCLPLLFSKDRHLVLLSAHSQLETLAQMHLESQSEEEKKEMRDRGRMSRTDMVQLKALCLFSRYFNCPIESAGNRPSQSLNTSTASTCLEDLPEVTNGICQLIVEYREKTVDSVLYTVLVKMWCNQHVCSKYAQFVDEIVNQNFSRHTTSHSGHFVRSSASGGVKRARSAIVPPHLFKELVQTEHGAFMLFSLAKDVISTHIHSLSTCLPSSSSYSCSSDKQQLLLKVKAAIWGVAHIASTHIGFSRLPQHALVLLVMIAEECEVYSLRGVAMAALNLLCEEALSFIGALGWISHVFPNKQCPQSLAPNEFELDSDLDTICSQFCAQKKLLISNTDKVIHSSGSMTRVDLVNDPSMVKLSISRKVQLPSSPRENASLSGLDESEFRERNNSAVFNSSITRLNVGIVLPVRMRHLFSVRGHRNRDRSVDRDRERRWEERRNRSSSSDGVANGSFSSTGARDKASGTGSSEERRESVDSSGYSAPNNPNGSSQNHHLHISTAHHTANSSSTPHVGSVRFSSSVASTESFNPYGTNTPLNRPRILTVRSAMQAAEANQSPYERSIDGVTFSVSESGTRDRFEGRTGSEMSSEGSSEKVSNVAHESEKCIHCRCFSSLVAVKLNNFSEASVTPNSVESSFSGLTQSQKVYLPKNYREKFLFWAAQLCSLSSKDAANSMEIFMRKFVFGLLKVSAGWIRDWEPVDTERYESSSHFESVQMHKLICLYSDCLLLLDQNACSAACRLFVHKLFHPILHEQMSLLQQQAAESSVQL